jgi:3-(3-hydroxy-phenyl)propionate hydroxylase
MKETTMTSTTRDFDVIVVGYGPTGMVLASLLGERGHRVAVVERWPGLYGKPRLTHIDGETARLVSLAGDGEQALREAWTTPHYHWKNGKGQLLMDVAQGNTRRMLWDDHLSVHQPHIEEAIDERIASLQTVQLFRGYAAGRLEQHAGSVRLTCGRWSKGGPPDSAPLVLQARYLVGADGAKSFVREALGVERTDYGFNERWLCVDTEPLRKLPAKFDENAIQICDPRRGYMFMPIGRKRQRFEFALLPGETTESMSTPDAAYRLLQQYHGLTADDVSLIRNLVYTFECRLAKNWRMGQVFLAGDAAHTNPPYLGQGACSGMRDAANLAWKFDLVLRGVAEEALLDSYEIERKPHARKLMLDARSLGLVANTANPVKAAIRDLMFKLKLTPKPQFPVLTGGMLAKGADGKPAPEAGSLPGQGRITVHGRTMRFDAHVGFHFALVATPAAMRCLPQALRSDLHALGVRMLELAGTGEAGVTDVDGVYTRLLETLGAEAALIRPDFVLYGHAPASALAALLHGFVHQVCGKMAPAGSRQLAPA